MIQRQPHSSREVEDHLDRLRRAIGAHPSMAVAYSGGVDSGLLAYMAHQTLGDSMLAVIGVSPSLATSEERAALTFLERHGIPYARVHPGEVDDPRYRANGPDRCFFCKEALFRVVETCPETASFQVVAYGANTDDRNDHRPGARSASQRGVVAPLADAGLDKQMVRAIARALSLELWDKPAAPCLASRIPYHSEVTPEKLRQIETAEAVLDALGFCERRVRHYGDTARLEVPIDEHPRMRQPEVWRRIENGIHAAGFKRVELTPDGLRSGRLNDAL